MWVVIFYRFRDERKRIRNKTELVVERKRERGCVFWKKRMKEEELEIKVVFLERKK